MRSADVSVEGILLGYAICVRSEAVGHGRQERMGICSIVRYNLMFQHPSDWHNITGVIRQTEEHGMGIILMRPLTSGVFQRLMAEAFPEIDTDSRVGAGGGSPAAQLRAFGSGRGRGAGRHARAAVCGVEQRDLG